MGTEIKEGTILLGKQGQSASYAELNCRRLKYCMACPQTELNKKYGHLWKVTPVYADRESVGIVPAA